MKPESRPTRNNRALRRINAVLLCLSVAVFCNLLAGWLIWQQWISGELAWSIQLLCAGVLAVLMAALFILNRRALVAPIRSIADWASRIRQGDFSARLERHSGLHTLTDDINRLAEWLESLAELKNRELLEQGVRLKTQTNMVRLLYDISADFSRAATPNALLERTLRPMAEVLEAERIVFYRLAEEDRNENVNGNERQRVRVAAWDRSNRVEHVDAHADTPANISADCECVKIPVRLGGRVPGECHLWFAAGRFPLPDEFSQLLYALCRNLSMALERIDLYEESARLSRMRERTHLANELHDSLAQTIAGLRFQVRILDELLHQQEEHAVWQQLEKVENMLEEANAELRSLIGYFHAPIDPGGLHAAIQAVVARFRRESEIPLFFQEQWGAVDIPEKWQLEIVRIIQEALNNIRRHSDARNARVLLRRDGEVKYTALVEDDGVGSMVMLADANTDTVTDADTENTENPGEHIGLSVMAQRAKSIGAEFYMDSEPGEGTRILLSFQPPPKQVPTA